jgi:hypothetical protein
MGTRHNLKFSYTWDAGIRCSSKLHESDCAASGEQAQEEVPWASSQCSTTRLVPRVPRDIKLLVHTLACCRCLSLNICQKGTLVLRRAQLSCARAPTWEVQPLTAHDRPTLGVAAASLPPPFLLPPTHVIQTTRSLPMQMVLLRV